MKTSILTLMSFMLLSISAYGQIKASEKKDPTASADVYYDLPVPQDLKAGLKATIDNEIAVETVKRDGVTYKVRVTYMPSRGKESIGKLEITSDNPAVNRGLKNLDEQSGRPFSIGGCYKNNKSHTGDWNALAVCSVDYVQNFIKLPQKN